MTARLTPLGVMLLALLREGDMHPYEMRRLLLERHDDRLVPTTTGAVYNAVSRLEAEHLVVELGVDRDGRRPERTTYRLTEAGTEAVTAWVRHNLDTIGRPAEFRVALAESHNLPLEEVIALLTRRRATLATLAAEQRAGLDKAGTRGVPALFLLEIERDQHLLEADLAWLDGLLDRLRGHEIDWLHAVVGSGRAVAGRAQPDSAHHGPAPRHTAHPDSAPSGSSRPDSSPPDSMDSVPADSPDAADDTTHIDTARSDAARQDDASNTPRESVPE